MDELFSPFKPPVRPRRSPRLALGGTFPANVLVFPVIEPTMIRRLDG
uniref:Uncharacterized protein n=1 Tax=Rhizophora mucronata TaxID=61149 RepID=A0A2P2JUF6_RHIMU